ncbi:SusC/RagA family TonB-linked outer membrane protein [Flavivirga amylovorans]|uniref:SusC/RagA family TonB-linked outer membrane protein n=2 Tax=Flavivirga amylovorans TaxID=870486 RepID=A0ABT8WWZ1_9FLAO|nr:SusC/RagA family TonB-linked outer membrane protein [Flavivirga amylovorans]
MGQQVTVSGNVTNSEDGMPIPGVALVIKGTSSGAVTDFDGNYSINAKVGDILNFTYLGMEDASATVTGSQLNIIMNPSIEGLDEVVIIGYGQQTKKELTGAVTRVKAEDIESIVTADLGTALQGQVTGVNVTNAGQIGAPAEIFIRGVASIFSDITPLYVVDGIPQSDNPQISPNEIESIDVLKDAASAAVYGSRGSNGVILITTKSGKGGVPRVTYSTTTGIRRITSDIRLMNARETFLAQNLAESNTADLIDNNIGGASYFNDSSLLDHLVIDDGLTTTHDASVSGGSEKMFFSANAGYFGGEGVLRGSESFSRYNGRINASYRGDKLSLTFGVGFIAENSERSSGQSFSRGQRYSPLLSPINGDTTVFEINGNLGGEEGSLDATNFINLGREQIRDRMNTNLRLSYNLSKKLVFTSNVGFITTHRQTTHTRPQTRIFDVDNQEFIDVGRGSLLMRSIDRVKEFSIDGSLTYNIEFGKSRLTLLGVISAEDRTYKAFTARAEGSIDPNATGFGNFPEGQIIGDGIITNANVFIPDFSYNRTDRILGAVGRFMYNYDDRYLLTGLVRRDGSSKFAEGNRVGYFPSVTAGWNVSNENFWSGISNVVNNFKIRASWGNTGNDRIPSNLSNRFVVPVGSYPTSDTEINPVLQVQEIPNPDIKWETTVQRNIGIDLGFLRNKFTVTADYYITDKKDLLFERVLPGSAGANSTRPNNVLFNRTIQNFADLENKGLELSVGYKSNKKKNFKWSARANYSTFENILTNLPRDENGDIVRYQLNNQTIAGQGLNAGIGQSNVSFLQEGYSAGALFLFETDGVIKNADELADYIAQVPNADNEIQSGAYTPQVGDLKYVDTNGDGKLDRDDKVFSGTTLPDFDLSFNLKLAYKNWSLDMLWYGAFGAKIYNGAAADHFFRGRSLELLNQFDEVLNPTSNTPKTSSARQNGNARFNPNLFGNNDRYLEDADFARLRSIRLQYDLSKEVTERLGINKFSIFAVGNNVITLTKYSGLDPEVSGDFDERNPLSTKGVDRGRSPVTALYSLGLSVEF